MLYKFRSKATGDLVMTGVVGDAILRLLGREPATQGIFTVAQMPGLVEALVAAVAEDERQRAEVEAAARAEGRTPPPRPAVGLRQRAWPLIEMLKRAQAASEDIVWGA